jgi:hypothetical protein
VDVSATTVAANGTATVQISVFDIFDNPVLTATPADFTIAATRGVISGVSCNGAGVCTATYTAPATSGPDAINVTIGGVDIFHSPLTITIP